MYDVKWWSLFHLLQIIQVYTLKYLKYHNLQTLSMLEYNVIEPCEEIRPVRLDRRLINTKRINVIVWLDSPNLLEKYDEQIKNAEEYFTVTTNPYDDDLWFAFMDIFSRNKLIIEYLLRRIPILDFKLLLDYKDDEAYKWFEALEGRGIYPKLKCYKRQVGYNYEGAYLKMGLSYSFILMNYFVVYVGDISKSEMIDSTRVEKLFYMNNSRFFKSYWDYYIEKKKICHSRNTKVVFIYNGLVANDICKEANVEIKNNRSDRLFVMTEFEFVYTLWAGINWGSIIKTIKESLINDVYDELKMEAYPFLLEALKNPDVEINEEDEHHLMLVRNQVTKGDRKLKGYKWSKFNLNII